MPVTPPRDPTNVDQLAPIPGRDSIELAATLTFKTTGDKEALAALLAMVGPQGPAGATGATGPAGATGATGPAGQGIRASGQLLGNTTGLAPAVMDIVFIDFGAWHGGADVTVILTVNGFVYNFHFASSDPSDGNIWIDDSSFSAFTDFVAGLYGAVNMVGPLSGVITTSLTTTHTTNDTLHLVSTDSGSSQTIGATSTADSSNCNLPLNASGTDAGGGVTEVELVAEVSGKTTFPGRIGIACNYGIAADLAVSLKTAGPTYTDLALVSSPATGYCAEFSPTFASLAQWLSGQSDASLVARMTGAVPVGGDATFWTMDTTQS